MPRHYRDRLALTYGFWTVVLVASTATLAWRFGWLPVEETREPETAARSEPKFARKRPASAFGSEPAGEVADAAASLDPEPGDHPPKDAVPDWGDGQYEPGVARMEGAAHSERDDVRVAGTIPDPHAPSEAEGPISRPMASARIPNQAADDSANPFLAEISSSARRKPGIDYATVPVESPPADESSEDVTVIRPQRPPSRAVRAPAGRSVPRNGAVMLDREDPDAASPAIRPRTAARFMRDDGFGDDARRLIPAGAEETGPPPRAAKSDPRLQEVARLLEQGDRLAAHKEMSRLYWKHPELVPELQSAIDDNAKLIYFSAQPHYMEPHVIEPGDQLSRIAKKYGVSWRYLAKLNQVDARKIRAGQRLKVIKGPFAALIDLSDFELVVHCHGYYVRRYPIGIGKNGSTPTGKFTVLTKLVNPTYYGPNGLVIDQNDPTNPLGERWIDLGDGYGLHGTIDPSSIGKAESKGCIRLRNADVEELFDLLTEGSEVVIRP